MNELIQVMEKILAAERERLCQEVEVIVSNAHFNRMELHPLLERLRGLFK